MDFAALTTVRNNLLKERQNLPIWPHKKELVNAIKDNDNCVIISSTGSGKTTQIPQFLFEAGLASQGTIAITQPRRLAAISVAQRVAEELGRGAVGQGPVSYCVRFEDVGDINKTRLRYMTDGMLLREAILDPLLSRYSIVIIDEAHERSLNTDVLLGVVLNASRTRKQQHKPSHSLPLLKIVIMSATIDPNAFVRFLGTKNTQVIYMEGRRFPIKILNTLVPSKDYVADAAATTMQMHQVAMCPPERGFLVFLTGEEEITRCVCLIRRMYNSLVAQKASPNGGEKTKDGSAAPMPELRVFPLFASLPQAQQMKAVSFTKPGVRKVIVCTNIAETSLTIPGIRYVVDCGRAKTLDWDPITGLESLKIRWISQSQAWQRSGRAGREAAGVCLRLYTDDEYNQMSLHPTSQLLSAPITGVLLNLLSMGVQNIKDFPWLEIPKDSAIQSGMELLVRLGAITKDNNIYIANPTSPLGSQNSPSLIKPIHLTKMGRLMTAFPLSPRLARALISAADMGCIVEAITAVSMLYVAPVFYVPQNARDDDAEVVQQFQHPEGDLASLILVYRAYNKAAKKDTPKRNGLAANGRVLTRKMWCRENYLNFTRLATAVKVRTQLKSIVQGSKLGVMKSCGNEDFTPLTKAFFDVAYRDQVAVIAKTFLPRKLKDYALKETSFPYYVRLEDANNTLPALLSIHPDSQMYPLAVVARDPPPAVLFIDAFDADTNNTVNDHQQGSSGPDSSPPSRRVLMRHVCVVSPDWLSKDVSEITAPPANVARKRAFSAPTIPEMLNNSNQAPNDSTAALENFVSLSAKKRRRRNRKKKQSIIIC